MSHQIDRVDVLTDSMRELADEDASDPIDPVVRLNQTIAQLTDVVRRHREAEARLRSVNEKKTAHSEARFRHLVESVRDYAILMLDPKGNIASWNEGAKRIKGYSADEIIGRHFSVFYPPEDVQAGKCELELEVAAREGRCEDESPRVRKDGSLFFANVVITALRDLETGELLGFAKVTRDLTERRQNEQDRLAKVRAEEGQARAEEGARLKDEFLATLSHELRTPLNAIVGWTRLLQAGALSTDAKRRKALDTIMRNARAQTRLMDDLLDVSSIVAGKFRIDVTDVEIEQVVETAIEVVRPAAEAKGLRLELVGTLEGNSIRVRGDSNRLQQALWNLLTNAVKFTSKGGIIHVLVERGESEAEITVSDDGAGITPEFLPHVFERFSQQSESQLDGRDRRAGGMGLGLAIVKHIVELHGGTIEARSAGRSRGSTFVIRLPIRDAGASSMRPRDGGEDADALRAHAPPELDGLRVLLIEDEEDARDALKAVLEHCRAVVTTAATVSLAFEVLANDPKPDVIVSDIGLPGEDGYSFIRRLRALPEDAGGRIPAVALTAFARSEDSRKALVSGFQSHAAKPIEPREILAVVASLRGRRSS